MTCGPPPGAQLHVMVMQAVQGSIPAINPAFIYCDTVFCSNQHTWSDPAGQWPLCFCLWTPEGCSAEDKPGGTMVFVPEAMFPDQVWRLAFELMLFLSKQEKPAEQSSCSGQLLQASDLLQGCRPTFTLCRSSFFNRSHTEISFCKFRWRKTSVERAHTDIVSGSDTV